MCRRFLRPSVWTLLGVWLVAMAGWSPAARAATPMVAAGQQHACALLAAGIVQCWGLNDYGQLGNGNGPRAGDGSNAPVPVVGLTDVVALAAGSYFSCALRANGQVACWGSNEHGQLGRGDPAAAIGEPVLVDGILSARQIAAGDGHACAVLDDASVVCWGRNLTGQLNDGTSLNQYRPVRAIGLRDVRMVSAGSIHTCVGFNSGGVRCWGGNEAGQLGNGGREPNLVLFPANVQGVAGAVSVSARRSDTCALLQGGNVMCWGGLLPYMGDAAGSFVPVVVPGVQGITAMAQGAFSIYCGLLTEGAVQCWRGDVLMGKPGGAPAVPIAAYDAPMRLNTLSGATAVNDGGLHHCAVLASGGVNCWQFFGGPFNPIFGRAESAPQPDVKTVHLSGPASAVAGECAIVGAPGAWPEPRRVCRWRWRVLYRARCRWPMARRRYQAILGATSAPLTVVTTYCANKAPARS